MIKRLWGMITSHLSMVCAVSIIALGFIGAWINFWPAIIASVLGIPIYILQYLAEKRQKDEMALINIRLQRSDIVAQEVFDKPYYAGLVAKPLVPATGKPMKLSAPPVKRKVDE